VTGLWLLGRRQRRRSRETQSPETASGLPLIWVVNLCSPATEGEGPRYCDLARLDADWKCASVDLCERRDGSPKIFKPIMTHDEQEPFIASLFFIGLPSTTSNAVLHWKSGPSTRSWGTRFGGSHPLGQIPRRGIEHHVEQENEAGGYRGCSRFTRWT